jgi:hypothetical protein
VRQPVTDVLGVAAIRGDYGPGDADPDPLVDAPGALAVALFGTRRLQPVVRSLREWFDRRLGVEDPPTGSGPTRSESPQHAPRSKNYFPVGTLRRRKSDLDPNSLFRDQICDVQSEFGLSALERPRR